MKICWLSVSFIVHMRIVNPLRSSKEKAIHHYDDLIVTVFEENSEITQGGVRFECQLRTNKSGSVVRPKLDVCG